MGIWSSARGRGGRLCRGGGARRQPARRRNVQRIRLRACVVTSSSGGCFTKRLAPASESDKAPRHFVGRGIAIATPEVSWPPGAGEEEAMALFGKDKAGTGVVTPTGGGPPAGVRDKYCSVVRRIH